MKRSNVPKPKKPERPPIGEKFQLLVDCRDEADQRRLYEWLVSRKYLCRVLVI